MREVSFQFNPAAFFNNIFNTVLGTVSVLLIASILIFLISWLIEPRRLINGTLLTIAAGLFIIWFGALIFALNNQFLINTSIVILGLIVIFTGLLVASAWILFLWNAAVVWRHENHSLGNMLTMLAGIFLLIIWLIDQFNFHKFLPDWLNVLLSSTSIIGIYLIIVMFNFLLNLALYQFVPKHYREDYLIVLGAGLIQGDQVSKLLGNRIERAISYYNKQIKKGRPAPKIIFSGGQGPDELISEASAMAKYAIAHGLPEDAVLLEDKSKTTLQNMQFSKQVAEQDFGTSDFKAKFFSNNYHIFRAGLFAKKAHLNANGVGAKTRFYFLPNAIIREFAAVFMINKKRHFIIISLIFLAYIILAIGSFFVIKP